MRTLKDLLEERTANIFTGRKNETSFFHSLLDRKSSPEKNIVQWYGIGGIGKSALVTWLGSNCLERGIPYATVDIQNYGVDLSTVLQRLRGQFQNDGKNSEHHYFADFDKIIDRIAKLEIKLAKKLSPKQSGGLEKTKEAGEATTRAAGAIIGGAVAGPIGGAVGGSVGTFLTRVLYATRNQSLQSLRDLGISADDARILLELDSEITRTFVLCLNILTEGSGRTVISFDTYEHPYVTSTLDHWVRTQLIPLLSTKIVLVIAGREKVTQIDYRWASLTPIMDFVEVLTFNETESAEYLTKRGIADPDIKDEIIRFSGGLPLALATAADLYEKSKNARLGPRQKLPLNEVIAQVSVQLLNQIENPKFKDLVLAAAIPRSFDADILRHLLGEDDITSLFKNLRSYSFVRIRSDETLYIHDVCRYFLLKELKLSSPERFKELNRRAMDYYYSKLPSGKESLSPRALREYLYHALRVDETEAIKYFVTSFEELEFSGQFDLRESLIAEVAEYDFELKKYRPWKEYCRASQLLRWGSWEESTSTLESLLENEAIDHRLRLYALESLGEIYVGRGKYDEALKIYQSALELRKREFPEPPTNTVGILTKIIEVCGILSLFDKAEDYAKEGFKIVPQDTIAYASILVAIGTVYRLKGETNSGVENLEKAIKIFKDRSDKYAEAFSSIQLARLYTHLGRWKRAEGLLSFANEIMSGMKKKYDIANVFLFRGNISRLKRDWENASKLYDQALKIHLEMDSKREIGPLYGSLGIVYYHLGKKKEALELLHQSLHMKLDQHYERGAGFSFRYLGDYYRWEGAQEMARENYEKGREIAERLGVLYLKSLCLLGVGRAYQKEGNCTACLKAVEDSFAVAQKQGFNDILAKILVVKSYCAARDSDPNAANMLVESFSLALRYNCYLVEQVFDETKLCLSELLSSNPSMAMYLQEISKEVARQLTRSKFDELYRAACEEEGYTPRVGYLSSVWSSFIHDKILTKE